MRFWIEITNAAGTKQGRIDNALYWRSTARLDRAGDFEFAIPAADAKASLLTNQYRAYCYGFVNDAVTELGAGIVEQIVTRQSGKGAPVVVVSGGDLLRELQIHLILTGAPYDIPGSSVVPDLLIDLATTNPFPGTWTLGGELTTASDVYATFDKETIFNGLARVAKATGEHFRWGGGRTLTWLGPVSNFAASGLLATTNADPASLGDEPNTCLITDISETLDGYGQANRFLLYGSGGGEVQLSLLPVVTWPPGFVDATSGTTTMTFNLSGTRIAQGVGPDGDTWWCDRVTSYLENVTRRLVDGYLVRRVDFRDVSPLTNTDADLAAAADYLLMAGYNLLRTRTQPQRVYSLALAGLSTIVSVGETIAVLARSVTEDDAGVRTYINIERDDLIVLETQTQIDERGAQTVGLLVATTDRYPESNESAVIDSLNESHTALVLPQMSASVDTTRYQESIDDSYNALFWFWLSDYVTTVNQVILRFRVDPLRSTVKSVTGGSGGSSSPTSSSESTHTHTTPAHYHSTTVVDGSAFTLVGDAGLYTSGGIYYIGHDAGGSSHPVTTVLTGEGGTTSAAGAGHSHTVTIAAHTHPSTGVYGIYEESGGNTYAYSDVEFLVNGSAASGTVAAISGAAGWYDLDLTADVVDSVGRPVQAANYVTVRVKAASHATKTVQVTGEIERRCTIQSIVVA